MKRVWGLSDGSAGMKSQIDAVAELGGWEVEHKTVELSAPWSMLPVYAYSRGWAKFVVPAELCEDVPEVVISCGRRGAMMALAMQQTETGERPHISYICLQDPRVPAKFFDCVIAMEHDSISGPNVIKTRYALHRITPELLKEAQELWESEFVKYPAPRAALLVGGTTNRYRFTSAHMQRLVFELKHMLDKSNFALLITPSRRTGKDNIAQLQLLATEHPAHIHLYSMTGPNPYLGMLTCADYIIVTNDSVNMMTDAYMTGKPLYIFPLPGHVGTKPAQFAEKLITEGAARWFTLPLETFSHEATNEMDGLKEKILSQFG
jgi:mitochondrial fission protein ELM1